jgi:anti-anti-sigma regulatory factor
VAVSTSPSKFIAIERAGDTLVALLAHGGSSLVGQEFSVDRNALIDAIHHPEVRCVVFDFGNAEYFGSLLLDTLCMAWKHARECAAGMALCNVSAFGQEILRKAKLNMLWPVFPSREQAIEALRTSGAQNAAAGRRESRMPAPPLSDLTSRLQVLQTEPIVVIGFGGHDLPADHVLGRYLGEIGDLLDRTGCRELAFELEGIVMVPSGFLGMITSIIKRGVVVAIRHPSPDVRDVLELTHFDQIVKLDPPSSPPE